uniref:Transcription factor protein n=1 Tax=Ciona intestinalis TaxID=7719 RepID=Q4H373_CIOIN|nr:transcription factor protein [Ciona intestinalis]BAE06554.1 transcription factor protein [Ciona intestinalis]|eukprot:NP_001071761.1 transcription factor protein [Ciona intestinalis]
MELSMHQDPIDDWLMELLRENECGTDSNDFQEQQLVKKTDVFSTTAQQHAQLESSENIYPSIASQVRPFTRNNANIYHSQEQCPKFPNTHRHAFGKQRNERNPLTNVCLNKQHTNQKPDSCVPKNRYYRTLKLKSKRQTASERERLRMQKITEQLMTLKHHLPDHYFRNDNPSKVQILRKSISYIHTLSKLLQEGKT